MLRTYELEYVTVKPKLIFPQWCNRYNKIKIAFNNTFTLVRNTKRKKQSFSDAKRKWNNECNKAFSSVQTFYTLVSLQYLSGSF
jgi:hypothetical protein